MSRRERDAFWSMIPLRGRVLFFGAVFFVFAPGIILPTRLDPEASVLSVAIAFTSSGLIGMFWAMAFTRHLGWLAAALGIQVGTFTGFGGLLPDWAWPRSIGFDWVGATAMALVALGYGLFIAFISTEGRRSLRERTELALAQQIHASLVPPIDLAAHGYRVLARSMPSTEVGGDLVDAVVGEDHLDLYLGDVTGHGVRSGVVMAMCKSAIHTARRAGADLSRVFSEVNDVLDEQTDTGMFVTAAAVRCGADRCVTYTLAGHLPILWWRKASGLIERLENDALPLAVMGGQSFQSRQIRCEPGDLLVVLTDGFIEVAGRDGRQLGIEGFERLVAQHADRPLGEMFDALVDAVREVGAVHDDQTLLLVRVGASSARAS